MSYHPTQSSKIKPRQFCFVLYIFIILLIGTQELFPVCARVKLSINQELSLERQVFYAHMTINNGTDQDITNIKVNVIFQDANKELIEDTSQLFYIRYDDSENVGSIESTLAQITNGQVSATQSGKITWFIIPMQDSSSNKPLGTKYFVGATITYEMGGVETVVNVIPDDILVKPLPDLILDYFCPTDITENMNFNLGLRIKNQGVGVGRQINLKSAQPFIDENQQQLLFDLKILGCEVQGQSSAETLTAFFGDIEPNRAKVARWIMNCNYTGEFTGMDAQVYHSDELGGELTSTVTVKINKLVKEVWVDLPGRDGLVDFLAVPSDSNDEKIYESEVQDPDPVVVNSPTVCGLTTPDSNLMSTLTATIPLGFAHLSCSTPAGMGIKQVIRSDGKMILPANTWLKGDQFHLFDYMPVSNMSYTVYFTTDTNEAPTLGQISDVDATEGTPISFGVTAQDDTPSLLTLSATPLPNPNCFTDNGNGSGQFSWTPQVGQAGDYYILFKASDGLLEDTQMVKIRVCSTSDTDCDEMPDSWETEPTDISDPSQLDPNGDLDGDGISNLDEYLNGTDLDIKDNSPEPPVIISPVLGSTISTLTPVLDVQNGLDTDIEEEQFVTYDFEIYSDREMTQLIDSVQERVEGVPSTTWPVSVTLEEDQHYYWRVRSRDHKYFSAWVYGDFLVSQTDDSVTLFQLTSPANGIRVDTKQPILTITEGSDPENGSVLYTFEVFADSAASAQVTSGIVSGNGEGSISWQVDKPLKDQWDYYWRVKAADGSTTTIPDTLYHFRVDTTGDSPTDPAIQSPVSGEEVQMNDVDLIISNSSDPSGDSIQYIFELDEVNRFDSNAKQISSPIEPGDTSTRWRVFGLKDNTRYFWRVKAVDPQYQSQWIMGEFFVNQVNDAPSVPVIKNPGHMVWIKTVNPTLETLEAKDIDGDTLDYRFQIYGDEAMEEQVFDILVEQTTSWNVNKNLDQQLSYFWRVRAEDEHGLPGEWTSLNRIFISPDWQNSAPTFNFVNWDQDIFCQTQASFSYETTDDNASVYISFYYDTDNQGYDGPLISQVNSEGGVKSFTWNMDQVAEGTYYIYAIVTDLENTVQSTYSVHTITKDQTPPTVSADPPGGNYYKNQSVVLNSNEPGTIYYTTTPGGTPDILYSGPVSIGAGTTTLTFKAVDQAGNESLQGEETYTITAGIEDVLVHAKRTSMNMAGFQVTPLDQSGVPYTTVPAQTTDSGGQVLFNDDDFTTGNYSFRLIYLTYEFASSQIYIDPASTDPKLTTIDIPEATVSVTFSTVHGPVEAVLVNVQNSGGTNVGLQAPTDANGQVSFILPVGKVFKFQAYLVGHSFTSADVTVSSGGNQETIQGGGGELTITLKKEGLVVPMNNNLMDPTIIKGAKVLLHDGGRNFLNMSAHSNMEGRATFTVPAGNYTLKVVFMGHDFWTTTIPVTNNTGTLLQIPCSPKQLSVVTGFLVHQPQGIANQWVDLFTREGKFVSRALTTPTGLINLELPDGKKYKAQSLYKAKDLEQDLGFKGDQMMKWSCGEIYVNLTYGGAPVTAGLPVELWLQDGTSTGVIENTDANGQVVFTRIPINTYQLKCPYQNRTVSSNLITIANQGDVVNDTFSVGGGSFTYTVNKALNDNLESVPCYVYDENQNYLSQHAYTDSTGTVNVDLANGSYLMRMDYLGYSYWSDPFVVPTDSQHTHTIPHQDVVINVKGNFSSANPLENVHVSLIMPGTNTVLDEESTNLTNVNGNYTFSLPNQTYEYKISYLGYEEILTTSSHEIPLGEAQINVTHSGTPQENIPIYVQDEYGNQIYQHTGTDPIAVSGTTDSNGQVAFILPAGSYRFEAQTPNEASGPRYYTPPTTLIPHQQNIIPVSTGGSNFDLNLQKLDGTALAAVNCYLYDEEDNYAGYQATTDSNGVAAFELPSGRFKVRADYKGYSYWTNLFDMPGAANITQTIEHRDQSIDISGALDEVPVYLYNSSDVYQNETLITSGGDAIFNLPLGKTYKVRVEYRNAIFWSQEFTPSTTPQAISITSGQIKVVVKLDGVVQTDQTVTLYTPDNKNLQVTHTTATGEALFTLPDGAQYRFVVEYGEQIWSPILTVDKDNLLTYEFILTTTGE